MKPKEKAEQLVQRFMMYNTKKDAIKCALIAVDELIYETMFEFPNIRERYWNDVKQEIQKL